MCWCGWGARSYRSFLAAMRRMRYAEPEAAYDDVVLLLGAYPEALARFEVRVLWARRVRDLRRSVRTGCFPAAGG